MQRQSLHQRVAGLLDDDLLVGGRVRVPLPHGAADAVRADHVQVGRRQHAALRHREWRDVHHQRNSGPAAQTAPPVQIVPGQRILDEADDGMVLQLLHDREHDAQRASAVEVPVEAKSGRGDLLRCSGLLDHVIERAAMHLEDAVALGRSAPDLLPEDVRRARAGPGRGRHRVAHLLAHQLVDRHAEVLAHHVVEGHGHGHAEVAVDEVERAAADDAGDHLLGDRTRVVLLVPVPDEPRVGAHAHDDVAVDVVHADLRLRIVVPRREPKRDGDHVDADDLHGRGDTR